MIYSAKSRLIPGLIFILPCLLLNSCLDPNWDFNRISDEVVLSPEFAAPLVYGSITMDDVLDELDDQEYLKQDDDKLLYISFTDDLFSFEADDVLEIPDQEFFGIFLQSDFILLPEWIGLPINDTISYSQRQDGYFSLEDNQRVDSLFIKSMEIVIDVASSFKHEGFLTIGSDSILKDGVPFLENVKISNAEGNFVHTEVFTLKDYVMYLDNTDPDTAFLPLEYSLSLINSGSPILPSDSCDVSITLRNPQFSSVFGYFGQQELISSSGEFKIEMFDSDEYDAASLRFADPQLIFNISNSYGVPVEINLSHLRTFSRINNENTHVVFDPSANPFDIKSPSIAQIGDTVNTQFLINKDNCNLVEAMETAPSRIYYTLTGNSNPDGDDQINNFITDSSKMAVDFEVIVPVWFHAEGFSVEAKEDFDFVDIFGENTDIIDYFKLTMDVKNEFPTDVDIQVYFKDQDNEVLDSLFADENFLLPPSVNEDDIVEEPREQSKEIEFTRDKIARIEDSKFILIKANISTPGESSDDYVKFFSDYILEYKFKVNTNLSVNSRDL